MLKINKRTNLFLIGVLVMLSIFFIKSDIAISQYASGIDEEINVLNTQIQNQKKQLENIQKNQEEYSRLIKAKEQERDTLSNQLDILETRFKKSELEIEETILEISKNNLEVKKIEIDIENKSKQIERDKESISSLLRILYKQNQTTPLEIILLNNSLTDFVNQITYLENTNKEISESLSVLKINKEEMDAQREILKEKEEKLADLKKELENKRNILEGEIGHKEFILVETQKSEEEYKKLLAAAKRENDQAMAEISSLEKTVREKLAQKENSGLEDKMSGFVWPAPKNTITATFYDPSYPFRKSIGEHSGIDIRAAQGTTLRAAASGYVARVKFDGSTAYAYIMIIHADGFSTVYGHVSAVSVRDDEYVTQGQVIGRTGGAPRTAGAGSFSTGPHLHFEIRKNGIPINPLPYLP
jgi:murein DD-endopeptidase MepM/ murein hydrolase activator NlpD